MTEIIGTQQSVFCVKKWAPESPDHNPIKHYCGGVKTENWVMDKQATNFEDLQDVIEYLRPVNLQAMLTKYID